MSTFVTPDSKKEEFRKALEKGGVIDALTKVLVSLYEEPNFPVNATEYIKRQLGADTSVDTDALRAENEQLKLEVEQYKARVEELEKQLEESKQGQA